MKKLTSILLALVLLLSLAACSGNGEAEKNIPDGALSVVCTTFPSYDWARNILGDKLESTKLTLLLDNGVDLHNYQATADDIVKIHSADVFVYIGGVSDAWVNDVIREAQNENLIALDLIETLGDRAKDEEAVEGMEEEEEEEGEETDEHIWLSLKNAEVLVEAIAEALEKADAENAAVYSENAKSYIEKLNALDKKYEDAVEKAKFDTVLFGDRFPFRYLVDDYDLDYYAAFAGCSAETEASFETVSFLAGKVDELKLPAVIMIEGSDGKIAQTIVETAESEPEVLTMNSMQSTASKDIENGADYLSIMESNLGVLTQAIGA